MATVGLTAVDALDVPYLMENLIIVELLYQSRYTSDRPADGDDTAVVDILAARRACALRCAAHPKHASSSHSESMM